MVQFVADEHGQNASKGYDDDVKDITSKHTYILIPSYIRKYQSN